MVDTILKTSLWPCKTTDDYIALLNAYIAARKADQTLLVEHDGRSHVVKFNPELVRLAKEKEGGVSNYDELVAAINTHVASIKKQEEQPAQFLQLQKYRIRSEGVALGLCRQLMAKVSSLVVCPYQVVSPTCIADDEIKPWFDIGLSEYDESYQSLGEVLSQECENKDGETPHNFTTWASSVSAEGENLRTYAGPSPQKPTFSQHIHQTMKTKRHPAIAEGMALFGWALLCCDTDVVGFGLQNTGQILREGQTLACKIDANMADLFLSYDDGNYQDKYALKKLSGNLAFFFDYATDEDIVLSLLPIVSLSPDDLADLAKQQPGFTLFTGDEQAEIVKQLKQRQKFLLDLFIKKISANPNLLFGKISFDKMIEKEFLDCIPELANELLLAHIVKLAVVKYENLRGAFNRNRQYCKLAKRDRISVDQLMKLVSNSTGRLHKNSFICHVLQTADELGVLGRLFPFIQGDLLNNIKEGHLTNSVTNPGGPGFSLRNDSSSVREKLLSTIREKYPVEMLDDYHIGIFPRF